ncbi:MAG: ion transporter [Akkermansiaceae bacterium]|nr:ion transporter [Akkermansiaceae bacterium]
MENPPPHDTPEPLKERLWRIIFLSDTPAGRAFDVVLLVLISASVGVVMLESVEPLRERHQGVFRALEWVFTVLFTIEYATRVWVVRRKSRYVLSFFGVVDLLSVLPTYVALFLAGTQYLMVIRILRLLRMFRVLKMARHYGQANQLLVALRASRPKIAVFLFAVMTLVTIESTLMYLIEGEHNPGFSSIPQSIYWGIVTLTTVGYGDVAPMTVAGKVLASIIMLSGFAIIAVPTGIVTAEVIRSTKRIPMDNRRCRECGWQGHDPHANFCKHCGTRLER